MRCIIGDNTFNQRPVSVTTYDSSVEEALARKWGTEARNGWSLRRAGRILQRAQMSLAPQIEGKGGAFLQGS
jgi:hypothetical protein